MKILTLSTILFLVNGGITRYLLVEVEPKSFEDNSLGTRPEAWLEPWPDMARDMARDKASNGLKARQVRGGRGKRKFIV